MNCIRCGRPVVRFALAIANRTHEPLGWGPRCARKAFPRKAERRISMRNRNTEVQPIEKDPRQRDMFEELAA